MAEPATCRSCGRVTRAVLTPQEVRAGRQVLCRDCNREPFTVDFAVRGLIRRYGDKPEEFEAL